MTLTQIGRSRRAKQPKVKRAVLVYQAGIANVFAVDSFNMSNYGRNARRLKQGAFSSCEDFARGLAAAGVMVASAHCNFAGDIEALRWFENLSDAPFSENFRPVFNGVVISGWSKE